MKNHTSQGVMYDMSSLQKAIKSPKSDDPIIISNREIKCKKCGKDTKDLEQLKKHLISDHKTYKPCKNFSINPAENKCSWREKCGYS